MRKQGSVLSVAVLIALTVGACERPVREARTEPAQKSSTPDSIATNEATLAAAASRDDVSTTQLAHTQPTYSVLTIDGLDIRFPLTKVLLHATEGAPVLAEMFSDLPKSSLRAYDGNEMYLEMKLDAASAAKLDGATWRFKSATSGKSDLPDGIFLNGQTTHLQPFDVLVKFESRQESGSKSAQLFAIVMGQFRSYETGAPESLAPIVGVRGQVPVEIVQKR